MAAQSVPSRVDRESTLEPTLHNDMSHTDERNHQPQDSQSARKHPGVRATTGWDKNPELLQWRANVLLDEMMLGAVDIAASEVTSPMPTRPTYNMADNAPHADEAEPARRNTPTPASPPAQPAASYANGRNHTQEAPSPHPVVDDVMPPAREPQDEWARPAWHFAEPTAPMPTLPPPLPSSPSARAVALQEHTRHHQPSTTEGSVRSADRQRVTTPATNAPEMRTTAVGTPPPRPTPSGPAKGAADHAAPASPSDQWVFAAEQRYQQIAARQGPMPTEVGQAGWTETTTGFFDEFAANDYGYGNGTQPAGRNRNGQVRVNQSIRRSNLLPRMSTLDPNALQQEMVMLQTELEQALPAGHESRERALHLLQKAYTILHADPSRSAEVDYYLQQVRTIGQRVQETLQGSTLYHGRLRTYLFAWALLSILVIASRYFYQAGLLAVLTGLSGATTSLLAYNLLTVVTAFFAGALGGAVGAFMNMRQYAQLKQGFFDRKYSLRGLILPLIGGLAGLVLCLFFGLIYLLLRFDPATSWLFGLLPAVLALAFGILQEFIYGTRD
ncbi:MAG: hypothetical protein KF832_15575 [Caldilineaceae bacterium]|nr:hypothetical protein [Caldilineaceae bacterium]